MGRVPSVSFLEERLGAEDLSIADVGPKDLCDNLLAWTIWTVSAELGEGTDGVAHARGADGTGKGAEGEAAEPEKEVEEGIV